MKTIYVNINTVDKAKQFAQLMRLVEGDATLSSGRYRVDAKSVLGIFSLNLTKPILLTIENGDKISDAVMSGLKEYVIENN